MTMEVPETLQRVRRIETRLMRLCSSLGVDPTSDKVRVTFVGNQPSTTVEVSGLDVSYGDLLAFCRRSGISGQAVVVMFRGRLIGSVRAEEVK